ncbi:MAG: 2-C-methyl-D-erythritol 2,4-cyclodiphosphate synthase [Bacilli bacterium]
MELRTGFGYDIHRLKEGKSILLGGVEIPAEVMTEAHSDGDLVYHSIAQAIFSALGLEDIGTYFPDNSKTTENMDSSLIVLKALEEMKKKQFDINNIVIDIVAQTPRLSNYKQLIKESISEILSLPVDKIAVHANTGERVGPVGRKEAIECYCQLLLIK